MSPSQNLLREGETSFGGIRRFTKGSRGYFQVDGQSVRLETNAEQSDWETEVYLHAQRLESRKKRTGQSPGCLLVVQARASPVHDNDFRETKRQRSETMQRLGSPIRAALEHPITADKLAEARMGGELTIRRQRLHLFRLKICVFAGALSTGATRRAGKCLCLSRHAKCCDQNRSHVASLGFRRVPLSKQLEGMRPFVAQHAWHAPQDTQRFYCARRLDAAHIGCLPSELIQNGRNSLLGFPMSLRSVNRTRRRSGRSDPEIVVGEY